MDNKVSVILFLLLFFTACSTVDKKVNEDYQEVDKFSWVSVESSLDELVMSEKQIEFGFIEGVTNANRLTYPDGSYKEFEFSNQGVPSLLEKKSNDKKVEHDFVETLSFLINGKTINVHLFRSVDMNIDANKYVFWAEEIGVVVIKSTTWNKLGFLKNNSTSNYSLLEELVFQLRSLDIKKR